MSFSKFFELLLKVSYFFLSILLWLAEALNNYILWTLDLLKHSFIFFSLAFSIDIFLYVFCIFGHFALFGVSRLGFGHESAFRFRT